MTNQEEQLWNYIDGFCNDKKKAEVEAKLATDEEFHALYLQLLEVNQQLNHHLEIDEPSMSFTRNVMTKVEKEIAPVALKTKVDSRIVYAIGGFFALALLASGTSFLIGEAGISTPRCEILGILSYVN